jgi:hypothetical protein
VSEQVMGAELYERRLDGRYDYSVSVSGGPWTLVRIVDCGPWQKMMATALVLFAPPERAHSLPIDSVTPEDQEASNGTQNQDTR